MKGTLAGGNALKALAVTRSLTEPSVLFSVLLDQPSRPGEHLRWNRHTNLLSSLQIDHQLKLCRLLHRQIGRLCSFQDLVYVIGYALVALYDIGTVVHEPADIYSLS